jgi:fructose-specific PTS system IIA-like component
MHARPASFLEEKVRPYRSSVHLVLRRNDAVVDARSVLGLISAGIHFDDELSLRVSGPDEELALAELQPFLKKELAAKDEALPIAGTESQTLRLPRMLQAAEYGVMLRGTPVSRGLGIGETVSIAGLTLDHGNTTAGTATEEYAKLIQARQRLLAKWETSGTTGVEGDVLRAQAALLRDDALAEAIQNEVSRSDVTVGKAIIAVVKTFQQKLAASGSAYLEERALDLQDIGAQLLAEIYGSSVAGALKLTAPSIVVANHLTPGQFLGLDRQWLRGLVLGHAGTTSHTVILARSFGVPTLTGVAEFAGLRDGTEVILDANLGLLFPEPSSSVRRYYELEARKQDAQKQSVAAYLNTPGRSRDGRPLDILANVSSAEEAVSAFEQGAQGIGLFRTEMLFMDRESAPDEAEQTAIYSATLRAAAGRPVTFRTLDIGGDKPVPYLRLPTEANPFLGCRGARLYASQPDLIWIQLRALCRASATCGPAKIMTPMIATPEEMQAFRELVDEARAEFSEADIQVGAMIEVPSAVFAIPEIAAYADFFSIGTNDLIQYFLAADRDHPGLGSLYSPFHPAFLRLLQHLVGAAETASRPIGLCGELGENPDALSLLLGLGLNSISLGAPRILATKAALGQLDFNRSHALLVEVAALPDRAEVEQRLVAAATTGNERPMLDPGLIIIDSTAASKHEVIKELCDLLELQGRVADSSEVEEVVWQREETYSTGFGYGFAVPHGKSELLRANSIAVARLREPVEWGALDGAPVRVVILLAIRASDQGKEHLRVFSKLSRLIMRDEFRASLESAFDAEAIFTILQSELHSTS